MTLILAYAPRDGGGLLTEVSCLALEPFTRDVKVRNAQWNGANLHSFGVVPVSGHIYYRRAAALSLRHVTAVATSRRTVVGYFRTRTVSSPVGQCHIIQLCARRVLAEGGYWLCDVGS